MCLLKDSLESIVILRYLAEFTEASEWLCKVYLDVIGLRYC